MKYFIFCPLQIVCNFVEGQKTFSMVRKNTLLISIYDLRPSATPTPLTSRQIREKFTDACKVLRFMFFHSFTQFMMNILFAKTTHERFWDDLHKFHTFPAETSAFICLQKIYRERETIRPSYMFYLLLHIKSARCCVAFETGKKNGKLVFPTPLNRTSSQPTLGKQLYLSSRVHKLMPSTANNVFGFIT